MGTIADAVKQHLQHDIALLDTLTRGTASLRRTARWIINHHNLDATEEAVVSALRRYTKNNPQPPLTHDRELLTQTHINIHTGLTLLTLPRTYETQERLTKAFATIKPRNPIAAWPNQQTYRLLIEEEYEPDILTIFPPAYRDTITNPLTALRLQLPNDPRAISITAHATAILTHHGIPIQDIYTNLPETNIIVPENDTLQAHEALLGLTRPQGKHAEDY